MVIAPEHPLVDALTRAEQAAEVKAYQEKASHKSDLERTELAKDKSGVFTGSFAINPVNGKKIPIWISDYVLITYGTGAIMAVPAHDQRDWEFATKFGLDIIEVISGGDISESAHEGDGELINSANDEVSLNGLQVTESKSKITDWLVNQGLGEAKVNYKLRDWLFSRQRYWGEPIPIIHTENGHQPIPASDLPLTLPDVESYKPSGTGESPLANITDWLNTTDPETGNPARRETNTMPQWAGSCWYYLRFIDPDNDEMLVDPSKEKYWMPIDLYVGGAEHAVLHLLYARFWHKVLYDCGVVSTKEPFHRLVNQGMILGPQEYKLYTGEDGNPVSFDQVNSKSQHKQTGEDLHAQALTERDVQKKGDHFVWTENPAIKVSAKAEKMSKSRGNVINPNVVIDEYGADSLRLYEMFMGPLEQVKPWSMKGVEGVHRFLRKVWRLYIDDRDTDDALRVTDTPASDEQAKLLHHTIKKVTEDTDGLRFNTAIAAMMEFVNAAQKWDSLPRETAETFALLLSPYAPHLAEELWNRLGHDTSLAYVDWPIHDESLLTEDEIEIILQINGKMRGKCMIPADATNRRSCRSSKR